MIEPNAYALRKTCAEQRLDEFDPGWRVQFRDDWQEAAEFYGPRLRFGRLVNGGGGVEPPEYEDIPYRDPDDVAKDCHE